MAAALALMAVAAFAACSGGSSKPGGSPPATSNTPATAATAATPAPSPSATATPVDMSQPAVWAQFHPAFDSDGTVSPESAVVAAAIAFGPIEGVAVPAGRPGENFSASGPLRWLAHHWSSLSPGLQQAFKARFAEILPIAPAPAASRGSTLARSATGDPFVDSPGAGPYRAIINKYLPIIAGRLGRSLSVGTAVWVSNKPTNDFAHAALWDTQGARYEGCWITISPAGQSVGPGPDLEFIIAHELFHCFQADVQSFAQWASAPAWVHEGQAAWAGLQVAGDAPVMSDEGNASNMAHWRGWLQHPEVPLFARWYDAVGFYSLLQDAGVNVWGALTPMLLVSGSSAAYQVATQGLANDVAQRWASSLFRDDKPSDKWTLTGVAITSKGSAPPPVRTLSVANGSTVNTDQLASFAAGIYSVSASADVVSLQTAGYSRIADANSLDNAPGQGVTVNLCLRPAGCKCPEGSEGESTTQATAPVRWGVGGGHIGAAGTATGTSLEDWCKKKPTPVPKGIDGTWNGTWHNTNVRQESGTFRAIWKQTGTALAGTITVFDTPCLTDGTVTGTIAGSNIQFGVVEGQVTIAYTGTISGNTMSGTYQASAACANAQGIWTATKE